MFDTTVFKAPDTLQVRVSEHRAPTDDSIRLFGELRDKAIKSVLDAGVEPMPLDRISWAVMDAPEINGVRLHLTFFVDGRRCHEEITLHRYEFGGSHESQFAAIISRVRECVANAVSRELCRNLFVNMTGRIVEAVVR